MWRLPAVVFPFCAVVCKKYERCLESQNNFSNVWITGSANQKMRNMLDHTSSGVHKVAMAQL